MNNKKYEAIVRYLGTGVIPQNPSSTVSNFKREASNYTLNGKNLTREGKIVVKRGNRKALYIMYHSTHSGRGKIHK